MNYANVRIVTGMSSRHQMSMVASQTASSPGPNESAVYDAVKDLPDRVDYEPLIELAFTLARDIDSYRFYDEDGHRRPVPADLVTAYADVLDRLRAAASTD